MKIIQMHNSTVSQMMGYLLITEQGKVIAVDGGTEGDAEEFVRLVGEYGGHIDLWLLTHPHSDHVGVFWKLAEAPSAISVDCVWYSSWGTDFVPIEDYNREDIPRLKKALAHCPYPVHTVSLSDRFSADCLTIEILRIANSDVKRDYINNLSMVFKVTEQSDSGRKFTMLFLGDLGPAGGEELLNSYQNRPEKLRADAVQMAHHGQCGVEEAVYQAIRPKWSFWPAPEWLWTNTPTGCKEGSGPWKTLCVREWMKKLGAEPVTCLREHAVFDTKKNNLW